jgi:Domain of unknown function (DUF4258)
MVTVQPWNPAQATKMINTISKRSDLTISYTRHAKEQMAARDLFVGDMLYVLKYGFVYEEPVASTQVALFKYRIESRTPNSNNRSVRAVTIPDEVRNWIKLITVMWIDE